MTHICISKLTIIGSDNCLLPGQHQAIIWANAGILLIGTLGTSFSEILSEICTFSFEKMHLKMLSEKWQPFCLGLNVLTNWGTYNFINRKNSTYLTYQDEGRLLTPDIEDKSRELRSISLKGAVDIESLVQNYLMTIVHALDTSFVLISSYCDQHKGIHCMHDNLDLKNVF